jgi:CRISPR system Cascade subunit CasC
MNLIELHILQSFPVTCLNRDDVGAPKTAIFGGCTRARVSSQCWKRAIRSYAKDKAPVFGGQRTRLILGQLEKLFAQAGNEQQSARALAIATSEAISTLDNAEKGTVKTLVFFSPQELQAVADAMLSAGIGDDIGVACNENAEKNKREKAAKKVKDAAKKAVKALGNKVKDAADIAIFGRMVADDHTLTVEGACLFSHALSTHTVSNEIDFFSAVDDVKPEDDAGAGHIGTLEFNSACYYRYVGLNLHLLEKDSHLKHFSDEERATVVKTFLEASIMAVPTARKNSMFGFNPPVFVLGLRREGQPLSLVNAFEKAVRIKSDSGYVEPSKEALKNHWKSLKDTYSLKATEVCLPEKNLSDFIQDLMGDKHE